MEKPAHAFVLRIAPSGIDRVEEALNSKDLIIGWSDTSELLNNDLSWEEFRQIIHDIFYAQDKDFRRSGGAAGCMWRFIREMQEKDLVLIPYGPHFYVAEVAGPPTYDEDKLEDDTAYRRKMNLLNSEQPIPRKWARAGIQSRLKARQTCTDATDLIDEILEVLEAAKTGETPSFAEDLRRRLIRETQNEICSGRMDPYAFEELVAAVLHSLGSEKPKVIPRSLDKGADVLADFRIAGTFKSTLAVQAKHFQPYPPVGPETIDQLVRGMEAEDAKLGWVVTSGTFSPEAVSRADEIQQETDLQIELVDGELLATLIVETGLHVTLHG